MDTIFSSPGKRMATDWSVALPLTLQTGDVVIFAGETKEGRFAVNFGEGPDYNSTVLFHYNPRFDHDKDVVRNSKENGAWQREERSGGNPFVVGRPFELRIVIQQEYYECFVNGVAHVNFNHRIPIDRCKYLFITAGVDIHSVQVDREADPSLEVGPQGLPVTLATDLLVGHKIHLGGVPNVGGSRFNLNFVCGTDFNDGSVDVAFHFDPRFNYGANRNVVVINSREGGSWKAEERPAGFPFKEGDYCSIDVEVTTSCYKIYVDDQEFTQFNHRVLPLSRVQTIFLQGDFALRKLKVCRHLNDA